MLLAFSTTRFLMTVYCVGCKRFYRFSFLLFFETTFLMTQVGMSATILVGLFLSFDLSDTIASFCLLWQCGSHKVSPGGWSKPK